MERWAARGLISLPDPDLAAEMYELASEKLSAAGYMQYEISNWAKVSTESEKGNLDAPFQSQAPFSKWTCRHNLQYWRN